LHSNQLNLLSLESLKGFFDFSDLLVLKVDNRGIAFLEGNDFKEELLNPLF
jgi:hypothetical protein